MWPWNIAKIVDSSEYLLIIALWSDIVCWSQTHGCTPGLFTTSLTTSYHKQATYLSQETCS